MTQQSVVSQEFIDLSIDDVLDPNFDPVPAFWRSIKVFQMAFADMSKWTDNSFNSSSENL